MNDPELYTLLRRLVEAVERSAPPPPRDASPSDADAFVWHADTARLEAVARVNRVPIELLKGIERQTENLLANTRRFASGLPANNALLWGARGTGKSSLVKAVHDRVNGDESGALGNYRSAS